MAEINIALECFGSILTLILLGSLLLHGDRSNPSTRLFVGMLLVMLISGYKPFGKTSMLYSDMYHQYYPFFVAFRRTLRSGESLLYNWSIGIDRKSVV